MRRLALLLALAGTPAFATDLELDVAGQANGTIRIHLLDDIAPNHVERLVELAKSEQYDNVVFHRVIEGFMAQTGDVEFGKAGADLTMAGTGGSSLPNLQAEFSDHPFTRGTVGMARASDPNSGNSQFFIMFADAPHLNGQYTVVGEVTEGLDVLDRIRRGSGPNGEVLDTPDVITKARVID